jgi:hypothetical protein
VFIAHGYGYHKGPAQHYGGYNDYGYKAAPYAKPYYPTYHTNHGHAPAAAPVYHAQPRSGFSHGFGYGYGSIH